MKSTAYRIVPYDLPVMFTDHTGFIPVSADGQKCFECMNPSKTKKQDNSSYATPVTSAGGVLSSIKVGGAGSSYGDKVKTEKYSYGKGRYVKDPHTGSDVYAGSSGGGYKKLPAKIAAKIAIKGVGGIGVPIAGDYVMHKAGLTESFIWQASITEAVLKTALFAAGAATVGLPLTLVGGAAYITYSAITGNNIGSAVWGRVENIF